ncbi:MAG: DNA polymerase, partial [Synergistaceae bacterium]|nr:DNA polymerase [Synergistaceae bacterium]
CLKLALLVKEQAHYRGVSVPMTAASLAWNTFKSMNPDWTFHLDETGENFIRESYKGGHTENFGFGKFTGEIYCLDVNSLYPFVMREYLPNPSKRKMYRGNAAFSAYINRKRGFYRAVVNVPYMPYPPLGVTDKNGKYVFPIGTFEGVWTSEELIYATFLGVRIESITQALVYSDFRPYMRAYVDKFYDDKRNATNPGIKAIAKLYLNSLYGKSAQSSDVYSDDTELDNTISIVSAEQIVKTLHNYDILSFNPGNNVYMVRPKKIGETKKVYSPNSLPEWASWITSLARVVLHRGIMAQHKAGNRVLYCDTDSIFVIKDACNPCDVIDVDDEKLGAWGLDFKGTDTVDTMEIYGNKFYYCYNDGKLIKKATKGVPSRAELVSNDSNGLKFEFVKPVNAFREWSLDGKLLWDTYTKTIDYMHNQKRIIPKYEGKCCMTIPKNYEG